VVVEESNRNAFTGNRIVSAVLPGISIISSNGTKAYHNYIEGHESLGSGIRDVSIDGNSFYSSWDNGYPCGGNSWYGFNGPDDYSGKLQSFIGGDWIIDTPYMVSADSQDNYPFKETDGWTNHPILINSNVTVTRSWVKTYAAYVTTADIPGNTGSMSVAMPKLNSTHIRVYVDGIALPDPSLVQTDNGTHYSIYFEFTTGAHEITIQYAPTGDINADGVINILDLVKIAVTFGITIYDSVWSLDADVNNDKRVNIVDIVTVAIHFGHTG
jgi:parallel beta-helix repeat protein